MVIGFDEDGNVCESWIPEPGPRTARRSIHIERLGRIPIDENAMRALAVGMQMFARGAMRLANSIARAAAPALQELKRIIELMTEPFDDEDPHHAHNMSVRASRTRPMDQFIHAPAHASYIHQRRRQELRRLHPLR